MKKLFFVYWFQKKQFLLPLLVVISLFFSLLHVTPYWMTSDDVGMSMRAHGYGAFEVGSANLIFSNVLWGHFVRSLPEIGGILGYSLATYLVLAATAGMSCFYLMRFGLRPLLAAGVVFVAFFLPFIAPQFTINSGLAALTAMLALASYVRDRRFTDLLVFMGFSFIAFIIRWNEFLLICLVAAPLLASVALLKDKQFWLAALVLGGALLLAQVANQQAYKAPEWQRFNDLQSIRVQLTDYGLAEKLRGTPEAKAAGLSDNDLDLVSEWFFADADLMSAVQSVELKLSGAEATQAWQLDQDGLSKGRKSLTGPLREGPAVWLTLLMFCMLALFPSRRMVTAIVIFLAVLFYFGYIGRVVPLRVYYPVLALLLFFVLLFGLGKATDRLRRTLVGLAVVGLGAYGVYNTLAIQFEADRLGRMLKVDFGNLSGGPLVTWVNRFRYEFVYSPLERTAHRQDVALYALGSSIYAPTSKAYKFESMPGGGFIDRFLSPAGIDFVGIYGNEVKGRNASMEIYCAERHGGTLVTRPVSRMRALSVINVTCQKPS